MKTFEQYKEYMENNFDEHVEIFNDETLTAEEKEKGLAETREKMRNMQEKYPEYHERYMDELSQRIDKMAYEYKEFKKTMVDYCNKRHEAWMASDWELDKELERKMIKLEEENPEFYDRWFDEVFDEKINASN